MKIIRYMRISVLVLLLVVFATSGYFLAEAQAQEKVVKIGVLTTETGNNADEGQDVIKGAELAVEEINESGGVAGYKFKVVVADVGESETDKVKSAFERLVNKDEVGVIVTGYASLTNFEIELARQYQMPYMLAGNCTLTYNIISKNPNAYPTVFSVTPPYFKLETGYAYCTQWIVNKGYFKPMNKKVAIITSDCEYSRHITENIRDTFQQLGWTVPIYEMSPYGKVIEWGAILSKIRKEQPSVIVFGDYLLNNAVTFINQFLVNPTNSMIFVETSPQLDEFKQILGTKSEGFVWHMLGSIMPSPKYPKGLEWIKKFKEKNGYVPGKYGSAVYDEVYIYAKALKEVGDPKKTLEIGNELLNTDYWGTAGHMVMDKATHMPIEGEKYIPYYLCQWQEGKKTLIFPENFATATFKEPPWIK